MLNWLETVLLSLTVFYGSIGYFVYKFEYIVPAFVLRFVKYGAFTYKGHDAVFMKKMDLPKRYFRHFYVFASVLTITNLIYMVLVYFYGFEVNMYYVKFLEGFHGVTSPVSVLASMVTMCLIALQCLKRYYESHYMQVFAKSSKIYPTHYLGGYIYYLVINVIIVGQAPLFCGDQNRDKIMWADLKTLIILVPAIIIFFWAWYEQYQTNVIFANLRKDKKSSRVVTEDHRVPHGRMFESISSPHRFCEITIYASLLSIMQTKTFLCVFIWVLFNQVLTSLLVHKWYIKTFKNYPTTRHAVFKGIL